jgi:hypothetical protein
MKILQSEITATQTSFFPPIFGGELSEFHPLFPFS